MLVNKQMALCEKNNVLSELHDGFLGKWFIRHLLETCIFAFIF